MTQLASSIRMEEEANTNLKPFDYAKVYFKEKSIEQKLSSQATI